MATDSERLVISIEGRLSQFEKAMAKATATSTRTATTIETRFRRMDQSLAGVGRNAFRGLLVQATALIGAGAIVRNFIANTLEQQKVLAQLEAVLRSTGGAAGLSSREIQDMAAALQDTTTFGDEAVVSAQALLLTFTKIGRDAFPQAIETVLDMSTALNQGLKESAIQVGKALQDPVRGITALRRVGVNFSDAQRDVIKRLVETGQLAKAQALILKELRIEFGGSAIAARNTLGGALQALSNAWGDLFELGEADTRNLRLALEDLIQTIKDPAFKQAIADIGQGLVEGFGFAARSVQRFVQDVQTVRGEIEGLVQFLRDLGNAAAEPFTESAAEIKARIAEVEVELDKLRSDTTGLVSPFAVQSAIDELDRLRAKLAEVRGDTLQLSRNPFDVQRGTVPPRGGGGAADDGSGGGGGSTKKTPAQNFAEDIARIRERTEALRVEASAIGLSTFERERALAVLDLENEARRAGITNLEDYRVEIDAMADGYAAAAAAAEEAARRYQAVNDVMLEFGGQGIDALEGMLDGTQSLNDSLGDTLRLLRRMLLEALLLGQGPLATLFGSANPGGGVGGLLGGLGRGAPTLGGRMAPQIMAPAVLAARTAGMAGQAVSVGVKVDPSPLFVVAVDQRITSARAADREALPAGIRQARINRRL